MRSALLWGLAFVFIAFPASAFKISPFKMTLRTDGGNNTLLLKLENSAPEQVAVQVRAASWHIRQDGTEDNEDASKDFMIFPAQIVLAPREIKSVRLQYTGPDVGAREKAYRIIAEQLPVNLKDTPQGAAAVRVLLTFKAALYIASGAVKSDIGLRQITRQPDGLYRLEVENKGTGHGILRRPVLTVDLAGGRSVSFKADDLKRLEGENIQAGAVRVITLALPGLPDTAIAAASLKTDTEF